MPTDYFVKTGVNTYKKLTRATTMLYDKHDNNKKKQFLHPILLIIQLRCYLRYHHPNN